MSQHWRTPRVAKDDERCAHSLTALSIVGLIVAVIIVLMACGVVQ